MPVTTSAVDTSTTPRSAAGSSGASSTPHGPRSRAARVRMRRALALLAMTLVLPGSAQLAAGNRAVGRLAVRVWLGCWALAGTLLLLGFLWRGAVFWLGSSTVVLGAVRLGLCLLAVGWALLLIDAWRLGRPLELVGRQRLLLVGLNGLTVFAVSGALLFASHLVAVQRDFIIAMFGDGEATAAEHGRYNVLLIGGDAGEGRFGLRTDSMTVASIDEETGRTILFGLPRNMANFPFAEGSVLAERFPDGFDCSECTLNGLATWAADNPELFADSPTPGVDATIMGIEGITGLTINYYALVNMEGFRGLVQAMGGLTLNVRDRIPIGVPVTDWIEPGVRKLNGFQTLWFARSRESADDYARMARQKCVINAMLQQIEPQRVLLKFEEFARAGQELVDTDLPASELGTFAELALKARSQKITSVSFVPPAVNTSDPDVATIRSMIDAAVEKSQQEEPDTDTASAQGDRSGPRKDKGFRAHRDGATTGGSLGSLSSGYAANQAEDLSRAC